VHGAPVEKESKQQQGQQKQDQELKVEPKPAEKNGDTKKADEDAPLTPAELKKWQDYVDALEGAAKKGVEERWKKAKTNKEKRDLIKKIPKPDDEISAPATLVVNLPADAALTIQGRASVTRTAKRLFVSPPLQVGRNYQYDVEARVVRDGRVIVLKRTVRVQAGRTTEVSLTEPAASVARGN
jgi:uncharacterized protein (TIGR03000 family)